MAGCITLVNGPLRMDTIRGETNGTILNCGEDGERG